jgi:predicted nucleotidyltransferase
MATFGLQQAQIDMMNTVFKQYPAIEQVILYGSRAKGNYKTGSDIDLTLIETTLSYSELMQIENILDDLLLPYKIDLSQKRKISNMDLIEHINRVGQVFYEKSTYKKTG